MEVQEYIQTSTKTKTELLTELLSHDFFFANEVFVSDDILPHVCGGWLLIAILKFKPEAVDDLNRTLAECEDKYAEEMKARICRAIAPVALFEKGFRPRTRSGFIKRHLENTLSIVAQCSTSQGQIIEKLALQWVKKWCAPKYVHRYDNRIMSDILGVAMAELLICNPLIEDPPPGFLRQSKVRDGLPSTEWINFQTMVLEKACGWADPYTFKALQHPTIRTGLGLSIHQAKSIAADKEGCLKALHYDSMNVGTWLRYVYCFMRFYLDGATLPEISAELEGHSEAAYEQARLALKPYCVEGNYDLSEARRAGIPERILRQLFTQGTIRKARPGKHYSPDTKRNYPTKERISEWTSLFAQTVYGIRPPMGRRRLLI